jgi:hypothetical protein
MRKPVALLLLCAYIISSTHLFAQEPAPTPTPPSAELIRQANSEGETDGLEDGRREAGDTAPIFGRELGVRDGYRRGFERCEEQRRGEESERGRLEGLPAGELKGKSEGQQRGIADGEQEGTDSGVRKGTSAADQDALRDATPPAVADGTNEANNNPETAIGGRRDGSIAGERAASERAGSYDYTRGREDLRREKDGEAVQSRDAFSQRSAVSVPGNATSLFRALTAQKSAPGISNPAYSMKNLWLNVSTGDLGQQDEVRAPRPDVRANFKYRRAPRTYPTTEQAEAYRKGYEKGYQSGWTSSYWIGFDAAYRLAFIEARRRGCQQARNQDYRDYYNRGYNTAYREAYDIAYRSSYDVAREPAFENAYDRAYKSAYQEKFPRARQQYYREAWKAAYDKRTQEIYNAAFEQAKQQKYAEVYPLYSEQQYARGRADEEEDFRLRPVRLLDAAATETINNGLFEPGEPLRLQFQLRNYSKEPLAASDVRIVLKSFSTGATISQAETALVKTLRPKSVTDISDALAFHLEDVAAGKSSRVRVEVFYRGTSVGEKDLDLMALYITAAELHANPELEEGLTKPLRVRFTNQSKVSTDPGTKISLEAPSDFIELPQKEFQLGVLAPGESRVIEVPVIARTDADSVVMPMTFDVRDTSNRRTGFFSATRTFPLVNDYRVNVSPAGLNLRKPGLTRIEYAIRNVQSQGTYKSLQLSLRVLGPAADDFVMPGPNPQYLPPLVQGKTLSFVFPVMTQNANGGGTLELEIREAGRTVVIHRLKF